MKKNTSCGFNDHNGCPPLKPCDKAEVKRVDCFSSTFPPEVFDPQNIPVIDVPVVLAEVDLEANIEAVIHLPTPAREIKNIRKNVSLKQCRAIRVPSVPDLVKVYVTGVLHKNIEYVEDCTGFIRSFSTDVPFSCNQSLFVFNIPQQFASLKNSVDEFRFLDDKGLGADRCTFGQINFEEFNEPIKCKLLFSEILELDILKDFDKFGRFNKITEKVEVFLRFKLLQTQQFDPRFFPPFPDNDAEASESNGNPRRRRINRASR